MAATNLDKSFRVGRSVLPSATSGDILSFLKSASGVVGLVKFGFCLVLCWLDFLLGTGEKMGVLFADWLEREFWRLVRAGAALVGFGDVAPRRPASLPELESSFLYFSACSMVSLISASTSARGRE